MLPIKLTSHINAQVEDKHVSLRTGGILNENYTLGILDEKNPCTTGCWRFDATTGKHVIMVSPLAYHTIATPSLGAGVRKLVGDLFKMVYEHEAAHSLYTTKDLKTLNEILKSKKIPWRLLNLFEDVRIEHNWVRRLRRRFSWLRWEKYPADVSKLTPTSLLYWLKTEDFKGYRVPRKFHVHFSIIKFYDKVVRYFSQIRTARSTESLIPILEAWLKDFPRTTDDSIMEMGGLGTGDFKGAMAEIGEGVVDVKPGDRGPESLPSKPGDTGEQAEAPGSGIKKASIGSGGGVGDASGEDSEEHSGPLPVGEEETFEVHTAVALARMLDTAFKGSGITRVASSKPSAKLNLRSILRGCFDLPYIAKMVGKRGVPEISLLIDCSGSMNGADCYIDRDKKIATRTDVAGRILLRALSILARRGRIKGTVYLCASGGVNYRQTLPVRSPLDFKRFHGFSSSEGFGMALRPDRPKSKFNCFQEVTKNKLAICYTDGCLTDRIMDRAALHLRGVHTLGICCTARDRTDKLKQHFDTPISRESLWGLADALVRFLRGASF